MVGLCSTRSPEADIPPRFTASLRPYSTPLSKSPIRTTGMSTGGKPRSSTRSSTAASAHAPVDFMTTQQAQEMLAKGGSQAGDDAGQDGDGVEEKAVEDAVADDAVAAAAADGEWAVAGLAAAVGCHVYELRHLRVWACPVEW